MRRQPKANPKQLAVLTAWCLRKGYRQPKPGAHTYEKTTTQIPRVFVGGKKAEAITQTVRYNFTAIAVRKEVLILHKDPFTGRPVKEWHRLASGYISQVSINELDQIKGLKR